MAERYYRVVLHDDEDLSTAPAWLFRMGCLGIQEEGDRLLAFFPPSLPLESLKTILGERFTTFHIEAFTDYDWVGAYHRSLEPVTAGPFFITPDRDRFPPPAGSLPLHLTPGAAFGTGHHATTHLVLELMAKIDIKGRRCLDLGCGTGVLSLAASLLGACSVTAVDIDLDSAIETRRNSLRNGLPLRAVAGTRDALRGPFDILLCNILSEPLRTILTSPRDLLSPGGDLIISGVEHSDCNFHEFLTRHNDLTIFRSQEREEWKAWHLVLSHSST